MVTILVHSSANLLGRHLNRGFIYPKLIRKELIWNLIRFYKKFLIFC